MSGGVGTWLAAMLAERMWRYTNHQGIIYAA
jgi:hypothetical protein